MQKLITMNIIDSRDFAMKLTILEEYVAITFVLLKHGPLNPIQIEAFTHINIVTLNKYLVFLIQQGAIKKQSLKKSVTYAITPSGRRIANFFGFGKSIETNQKV